MKYLYRTYQLLIAAPLLLAATVLACVVAIIGCALGFSRFWGYYPGHLWAKAFVRLLFLPVHVEGRENMVPGQSYVIVPNHQGAFDIFLILGFLGRNFKWMLKHELRALPLVGKTCEMSGYIFVDNRGPKRIQESCVRAREILKEGISVVVFPEGARTWDGTIGTFHRGAFQIADELDLPLLPVTINGSFDVLPRQRGFNFVTWHPLSMTIHPAVRPAGHGPEAERATALRVRDIIAGALRPSAAAVVALLAMTVVSCTTPRTISGTTSLHQLEGRTLYLKAYRGGNLLNLDSTRIVHGHFAFTPEADTVCMASIFLGEQSLMPIVIDAQQLEVLIDEEQVCVRGSELNDSLFAFIRAKGALDDMLAELPRRESQMIMDGAPHDEIVSQLTAEATELRRREEQLVTRFIHRNMDNILGPGVFMILTSALPYPCFTPQIEEIVALATPRFLADPYVSDFVRMARENEARTDE